MFADKESTSPSTFGDLEQASDNNTSADFVLWDQVVQIVAVHRRDSSLLATGFS